MADYRFDYQDFQLLFWVDRIILKFPKLTNNQFRTIICLGVEGKWKNPYNNTVNLQTIFSWIENYKAELIQAKNDKIARIQENNKKLLLDAQDFNLTTKEILQLNQKSLKLPYKNDL